MTDIDRQLAEQRRISTDPRWCAPEPAPLRDGRHARSERTKAALVAACRYLMGEGLFRPSMAAICDLARLSVRSGFQHFETIEALRLAAADDVITRGRILDAAFGGNAWEKALDYSHEAELRLVRIIVTGRV